MSTTRLATRLLTSLSALLVLVLILAGVPAALWALAGSPLPSTMPSAAELLEGITTGPIADTTIIRGFALVGWLAWLHLALSILAESVVWASGATTPRLLSASPFQPAARKLVASAVMLLSTPNLSAVPMAAAASPTANVLVVEPVQADATPVWSTPPAPVRNPVPSEAPEALRTYVVQRRDTLWGLAESYLGDPFRWRDIYELNRGVTQADGRILQDPNLIVVGWELSLPSDAVGLDPEREPEPAAEPTPAPPAAEDEPSEHELPSPPTTTNAAPEAPTPSPTTTPPTTAEAPPTTAVPVPPGDQQPQPPPAPAADSDSDDNGDDTAAAPVVQLVGGALLAAALVTLIDRLRRGLLRRRNKTLIPLSEELQRAEMALRHAADLDGASRLNLALRALAAELGNDDAAGPAILAVRVDGDSIEVLFDQPAGAPPQGFQSTGDPRGWRLQAGLDNDELRALAKGYASPLASLVTIGTADGDPVLVDIETAGIMTVAGPPELAEPFLRRLGTELAASTWTEHLNILVVGENLVGVAGNQRVRHIPTLDDALHHLCGAARGIERELEATGHSRTIDARLADEGGDGWYPTILISSEPLSSETLTQLAHEVRPGRGVGIVAPGPEAGSGWHAAVAEDQVHLLPHNLLLEPLTLDAATAASIDGLVNELETTASAQEPADPPQEPSDEPLAEEPNMSPGACEPFADPPFDIEFRVLGNVDAVGVAPIERRKSLEIAVYLALHPEGVSDERLKTVFWPDGRPAPTTFNTTISMVRSALGSDPDGEPYFPHYAASGQLYRLSNHVTTDLARLEARAAYAKSAPPEQAREALEEALRLVRGQPFDVGRGYGWAFAEGFVTRSALATAELAHVYAEQALAEGDHSAAEWAAMQGLKASPGDEALYRDRMMAAHLAGKGSALKQIMRELCEAVEASDPCDDLQPETILLFKKVDPTRQKRG